MNKKKIYRLLSSTISGLYLVNTTSVFAYDSTNNVSIESDTIIDSTEAVEKEEQASDKTNNEADNKVEDISEKDNVEIEIEEDKTKEEESTKEEIETSNEGESDLESNGSTENNINKDTLDKNNDALVSNNATMNTDDNLDKISPLAIVSSPTTYKPTIDYLDGYVTLKDNGAILSGSKTIEDFNNPQSLEFTFSNKDWTVSNGVMKSKSIGTFTTTKNSISLNLQQEGKLSIKVRVSSTDFGANGIVKVNGEQIFTQNGNNTKFTTITCDLKGGINTIDFEYSKTYGGSRYEDAMIIDEIIVDASTVTLNSDRLEYRIDGGSWNEYTEPFLCEEGSLVEARGYHNSNYSDIESVTLNIAKIVDANLKKEFNSMFGKDEDNNLFLKSELETLTTLDISNKEIKDLSGLECAVNLTSLNISNNEISNIDVAEKMSKLESITANNNKIESLEPLSSLSNLTAINFEDNVITDISVIANLSNLNTIKLKNNAFTDKSVIDVVSSMGILEEVSLTLNMPSLNLVIGANGSFNNIVNLTLDGSKLANVTISNEDNLKYFYCRYAEFLTFTATDCSLIETINLNYSKGNSIDVNNIKSKIYLTVYYGVVDSLKMSDCSKFDNISIQQIAVSDSIILENLNSSSAIFNLDYINTNKLILKNNTTPGAGLYISYANVNDAYIEGITVNTHMATYSTINKIEFGERNYIGYIYYDYLKTESDLIFSKINNISSLVLNGAQVKSVTVSDLPTLNYFSLSYASVDDLVIKDCDKIPNFYISQLNAKNITLDNLKAFNMIYLSSSNALSLNIKNCTALSTVNNYKSNVFKSLLLENTPSLGTVDLSGCGIEDMKFINCTNLSVFDISNNNIKDVTPLTSLTQLRALNISDNHIADISTLNQLPHIGSSNIGAENQTIELPQVVSKSGEIYITHPEIIDLDGSKVPLLNNRITSTTKNDNIYLGKFDEGIHNKSISFKSGKTSYSAIATQKIIVDGTAPEINITPNLDYFTNKNVILEINATDELSGVDYIKLPNGDIVKAESYTLEIENNGSYEFEAVDLAGNSVKKSITISNIDKEGPTANSSIVYNTNKTEAIIKVEAEDDFSGVLNITLPDGKVVETETTSFMVKKNGTYKFAVRDVAGNIYIETVIVDSIEDKANNTENNTDKEDMPDTSGVSPIITTLSIISLIGGIIGIRKRKK